MVEVVGRTDAVQCLKAVWGFAGFFFPPLVMRPLLLLGLPMGPWFLQGVCPAQSVYFDWR